MDDRSAMTDAGSFRAPETLRLEQQLCFALYTASNMVTRLYRAVLDPIGITYAQYLVLMVLWDRSPQSLGEIGATLGLESGTLTPLVKRMEAAGLVTRRRDSEDERRVLIDTTQAGRDLVDSVAEARCRVVEELRMSDAEIDRFRTDVQAFNRHMKAS